MRIINQFIHSVFCQSSKHRLEVGGKFGRQCVSLLRRLLADEEDSEFREFRKIE
jgi:hypothetical protein